MKSLAGVLSAAMLAAGCDLVGGAMSYTLYRSSLVDSSLRVHVASFDASESEQYNRENCALAAKLFLSQPSVQAKFWCEKGRYKR